MFIMARDPDLLAAFAQLSAVVVVRPGRVDAGLKALVMQVTSQAAGCRYCSAHSGNLAAARGVVPDKVVALWDYERSPLFSPRSCVLRKGQRAPSEVTDEDFAAVRRFLDDDQLLEIVAVIAFMGFLNRWNDTLATPLEPAPRSFTERHLAHGGWTIGHHAGSTAVPPRPPRQNRLTRAGTRRQPVGPAQASIRGLVSSRLSRGG
jgi:alkylhydroperoxidase family enzyme